MGFNSVFKGLKYIDVDSSAVWLHMLFGPYQCVYGALFGIRLQSEIRLQSDSEQCTIHTH